MRIENSNFIDGRLVAATGEGYGLVDDASTGETIAEVAQASSADVEAAVGAAAAAQRDWASRPRAERVEILTRWADLIEQHADELGELEVAEVGVPAGQVRQLHVGLAVTAIRATLRGAAQALSEERAETARVVRQPVGVVAAITPWNYPLFQSVLKVAPALVAGCAVVQKPAEIAPLAVLRIAELAAEAGVAPGAYNVLNGPGRSLGQELISHPAIDFVSFTGSFGGGSAVAAAAARRCRPVALELGGKSASIVLDAAKLAAAARFTWASSIQNAGQTCAALSRLLVPRDRLDEAVAVLETELDRVVLGDAHDPATTTGPVVSRHQQQQILRMLQGVERDGNRFVGRSPLDAAVPERGWFVPPAIVLVENREAEIAREEVFGPVLCLVPFDDEDDALAAAEHTDFGLIARVWTDDDHRFARFAERMRVGSVLRNDVVADWSAPFGGVKDSGYGRERGAWGVAEYLVDKAIHE